MASSLSDSAAANLVSAMSTLVQDTDLADFTVTCGEMTWKLHANILALRSPFLKAAITTNMIEKLEMKIDIQDLDPKTMEEVVNYMYGKPIGNAPISFLFEAAERFQMCDLKKDVTKLAKQRMAEDNVVELAKLAEMYDVEDFLKECVDFIVKKDIYLKADLSPKVTKIVFGFLNGNLKEAKEVFIGEKCSECEDNVCLKATDMLKAAVAHKLDVHLVICKPVTEVDPKLITEALTNVSKFTVTNHFEYENHHGVQILSTGQFDHLFESIEKGNKIMENVNLIQLYLNGLDQEILVNCLVNKIKMLTLDQECFGVRMLDVKTFLSKLLQDSNHLKLTHLTLIDFSFHKDFESKPDLSSSFVVSALCHVENLKFCGYTNVPMEPLLENLLQTTRSNKQTMKTLIIDIDNYVKQYDMYLDYLDWFYDFGSLINPQDLKTLFTEVSTLQLEGVFTLEQHEAVSSLPDVEVGQIQFDDSNDVFQYIKKGSPEMF